MTTPSTFTKNSAGISSRNNVSIILDLSVIVIDESNIIQPLRPSVLRAFNQNMKEKPGSCSNCEQTLYPKNKFQYFQGGWPMMNHKEHDTKTKRSTVIAQYCGDPIRCTGLASRTKPSVETPWLGAYSAIYNCLSLTMDPGDLKQTWKHIHTLTGQNWEETHISKKCIGIHHFRSHMVTQFIYCKKKAAWIYRQAER